MHRQTIESINAFRKELKLNPNSGGVKAHKIGIATNEPCLLIADSIMRYASAFSKEFPEDPMAKDAIATLCIGVSQLLNYRGCVALGKNLNDSKCNVVIQEILEKACAKLDIDYHELS